MYSIDINFLRDRHLETTAAKTTLTNRPAAPTLQQQLPTLIGLGAMLLLIAFPFGILALVNWQTAKTQKHIDELNVELTELKAQNQKLIEIQTQIKTLDDEIQSFVQVFDRVKPYSAILQEIRNQVPKSVQIKNIQQTEVPPPAGATDLTARIQFTINGYALNYNDVNDFLLALQNSEFLQADKTKLVSAKLVDLPINVENAESLSTKNLDVEFPKGVEYSIVTQLNDLPASKLLPALARNGAVGLVARIKTLEQQGVIKR